MAMSILTKESHLIGGGLQFRGLVHFHLGREHGDTQADMGLAWAFETSKPAPRDTLRPMRPHFLISLK